MERTVGRHPAVPMVEQLGEQLVCACCQAGCVVGEMCLHLKENWLSFLRMISVVFFGIGL